MTANEKIQLMKEQALNLFQNLDALQNELQKKVVKWILENLLNKKVIVMVRQEPY